MRQSHPKRRSACRTLKTCASDHLRAFANPHHVEDALQCEIPQWLEALRIVIRRSARRLNGYDPGGCTVFLPDPSRVENDRLAKFK